MKICTFKVADGYHGFRYGELLLKPVFRYLADNKYDFAFVTAFEKHAHLLDLFGDFGFQTIEERTALGELVLVRRVHPRQEDERLPPAAFDQRYSPLFTSWRGSVWIVPIRPEFEDVLFPERRTQSTLFDGSYAFGNGIRKAYLCHSRATSIAGGDVLAFYRSGDRQAIVGLGTVDDAKRSSSTKDIAIYVARRTVYSESAIEQMCAEGEVLAIRFRQVLRDFDPILLSEMKKNGVLAPQSLAKLKPEALSWIRQRTGT